MPVVASTGRARLLDYGGAGRPVIFVPSLINPHWILDLAEGNSLLRWLGTQGLRPLLVDWGEPGPDERALSIAGHVETLLLPLVRAIGPDSILAGYCLGGTMALAAAELHPPAGLALIATPWNFSAFPAASRDNMRSIWDQAQSAAEILGLLPMEVLQTGFWHLDPAKTIAKFERFSRLDPGSTAARSFVALEDWANDGPPLTLAAGWELVEDMFGNDVTGRGEWRVGGRQISRNSTCPTIEIVSANDRIVPADSTLNPNVAHVISPGHVGMIVGGRSRKLFWEPLRDWLLQLRKD